MKSSLSEVSNVFPKPKFALFQAVRVAEGRSGIIIGVEYVDPIQALLSGCQYGFSYCVNHFYGKSVEELVQLNAAQDDLSVAYWEDQLAPVEADSRDNQQEAVA